MCRQTEEALKSIIPFIESSATAIINHTVIAVILVITLDVIMEPDMAMVVMDMKVTDTEVMMTIMIVVHL